METLSKYTAKRSLLATFLIIAIALLNFNCLADEKSYVSMELSTWKYTDNLRDFTALLLAETEDGEEALAEAPVNFFVIGDNGPVQIGVAVSDTTGRAVVYFDSNNIFPCDEEGYISIFAEFEGSGLFEPAEDEMMYKDVLIDISFTEEDEMKFINFAGQIRGPNDEMMPLADDDIYFFVPRMFSLLKIADGWFEENGEGYVDYPTNIIGDSLGNLKVIGRILDHPDYGNVEKFAEIDWAIPRHLLAAETPTRELWTPIAPLWMIITLIIMLAGVWGHYFYAIYELYMIKKIGDKNKKSNTI
nr:hypothetical protein [Bacteroidota bacterium]